jgi:uncharacterized protein YndB with AHSA1/START domain
MHDMAVDVTREVVIARPRHEVASFAVDPDRIPLWYTNIRSLEWRSDPPLAVGTRLAFVAAFLRRRLEYVYVVAEHVPGERFVMRTSEGPFPMETTYTWRDAGDARTAMTLRNRGTPSGVFALLGPVLRLAMGRAMTKDLALLKAILESRSKRHSAPAFTAAPRA